ETLPGRKASGSPAAPPARRRTCRGEAARGRTRAGASSAAARAAASSDRPAAPFRSARAQRRSLALVARLALLHEGRHAFAIVRGESRVALQVALEIELRFERVAGRGVDRPLHQAVALRRPGCERARKRVRLG